MDLFLIRLAHPIIKISKIEDHPLKINYVNVGIQHRKMIQWNDGKEKIYMYNYYMLLNTYNR